MLVLLMSTCLLFNQPIHAEDFLLLNQTKTQLSASQGNQEFHFKVLAEQDRKTLRFDNQGRFLEVIYIGLKQLSEVELRTNFSGELVTHHFVFDQKKLHATEEAWQLHDLLEPEVTQLFNQWSELGKQIRRQSPIDIPDTSERKNVEGSNCEGLNRFGLGSDLFLAIRSLTLNCANFSCDECCKYYGCAQESFFLWLCEGRECEVNLPTFP